MRELGKNELRLINGGDKFTLDLGYVIGYIGGALVDAYNEASRVTTSAERRN